MNEDQLIYTFFQNAQTDDSVFLGIGDDAAVMDVPQGYQLVISTDTLVSGRHFPKDYSPDQIASRAVGVCVSDLAAMGAIPKWVTLSLSLPEVQQSWLQSFSASLHQSLQQYFISLIGGDTVKGELSLSLSVLGIVEVGSALRRDAAVVDDDIYVSGSLGGSAFALFKLLANDDDQQSVFSLFSRPSARVQLGRRLVGVANGCMDISDGILLDLSRLLKMSAVGADIYLDKVPLHPAIDSLPLETQIKLATSGDDYELLFTARPAQRAQIEKISKELSLPLSCIGKITDTRKIMTYSNGRLFDVEKYGGYQHF